MLRIGEHVENRAALRNNAVDDDRHLVANFFDDVHFVSDNDDGQREILIDDFDQVEDRFSCLRVERGGCLVAKENFRVTGEGAGDTDALFLPAAELGGILIGFVRDESNRRSKEVAIRKVNGAVTGEIIRMFVVDVLKLALIAAFIGVAIAYFVADKWLELFAMRIGLSPFYFIAGALAVLLIVTVVVVLSSNRIARMNPIKSLKNN